MDKRITLLNTLKRKLEQHRSSDNSEYSSLDQTKQAPIVNYSRLRAQMLVENVQSGHAFEASYFNNAGVYAESVEGEKLSFHIYPLISIETKSKTKDLETKEETIENREKLAEITNL